MPKIYFPGESVGRDGRNAPSPGNPASYPISGRRRIATLSKGGGAPYGYTISTISGVPVTYLGARVFDNSPTGPLSLRTAA